METLKSVLRFSLSLALVLGMTAATHAQRERAEEPKRENVRATGKIKGARGAVLHVMTDKGDQYLVKLPDNPQEISYVGTADASWLRPGMLVSFSGLFDKRGQAQVPIQQLAVISPRETTKIGVTQDAVLGGQDLFSRDEGQDKKPKTEGAPYAVVGKITAFRNGKMKVAAGRVGVQAEVADEAKISLDLADLRFARPDDVIAFEGWYYAQRPNQIYARRVRIEAAEPLTGEKKSKKKPVAPPKEPAEEPAAESEDAVEKSPE